jgi:hypothetical protein
VPGSRRGGTVALLVVSAVLFVAYPALRPYSSESGVAGARAFGSNRWVLAHTCGMIAFAALAAATLGLAVGSRTQRTMLLGVALILPYYGAEAFGLHAIGQAALHRGEPSLTSLADAVRNNPVALTLFGAGWIVLAIAGVELARTRWTSTGIAAFLAGAGLVLYLPQFFGPPWVRIAHGVVLAAGLLLLARDTALREASERADKSQLACRSRPR